MSRRAQPRDLLPAGGRPPAGHRNPGMLAPVRLRASWQRSRRYGVSPDRPRAVFVGDVDTGSLFYECGSEVLRGLAATVSGEPISLMATDAEGLVLLRLSENATITRSLDRVHLAPGFGYGERTAGTNGLGLALADRSPSLVHGGDHFCADLRSYTCAAVPVFAPAGDLVGSINLTTWSDASSDLLLALAQSAAGTTTALMQVRSGGLVTAPLARGEVYRVLIDGLPVGGADPCVSPAWRRAVTAIEDALAAGRIAAVVGEPGAGRAAAAAIALYRVHPGRQLVRARLRADLDAEEWLTRWLPELARPGTTILASGVDRLPAWAAGELAAAARTGSVVLAAEDLDRVPAPLRDLVRTVAEVPPLRRRPDDVLPLAGAFARSERQRDVEITADARTALLDHDWPGNVAELRGVVRTALSRADRIDLEHLPADVFTRGARRLTRLERLERDEIVRCLTQPGVTMAQAAATLGLSRATLYRKLAHYGVELPGSGRRP